MASKVQHRKDAGYSLVLEIEGVSIPWQNISGIVVRESVFDLLPRMKVEFSDLGMLSSKSPVAPGQTIKAVFISEKGQTGGVEWKFRIMSVTTETTDPMLPSASHVVLDTLLDVQQMYGVLTSRTFGKSKFSDVVEQVANDCGLKADVRAKSNDAMVWGCFNTRLTEFLKDSVAHSYISEKTLPVLFATKDGSLVYDSTERAIKSNSKVKLSYDATGSVMQSENKSVLNWSTWSRLDLSELMGKFGGGDGLAVYWYDEKPEKVELGTEITDKMVFGRRSLNVHKNYMTAYAKNRLMKNSLFGTCMTFVSGLYGLKPMDRVEISIPEDVEKGNSQALSGEYLVFRVLTVFGRDAKQEIVCATKIG